MLDLKKRQINNVIIWQGSLTKIQVFLLGLSKPPGWKVLLGLNHRPVSSVGRASDYRAGGRGFEPQTGPTQGCAAFVFTSANG